MLSALISVIILGLLVLIHELGHFFVAKWSGVRILRLSIGFGPQLFTRTVGETEYTVSLIPLGGYVKMAGEQQEEITHKPWEYLSKPAGVRAGIIVAGPFMNWVLATVCLWTVFVIGYPDLLPIVGDVKPDMPAQAAGLQKGDRIVALDGAAVNTWDAMTKAISGAPERAVRLEIRRGDATQTITLTPKLEAFVDPFGKPQQVGRIGIAPSGEFEFRKVGPVTAIGRTIQQEAEWLSQTLYSLGAMCTGRLSMRDSMTGPIGILHLTSDAVRMGIRPLLFFVSLISLMLALFNLFPVPILDGGHLLFLALEKLRGKPVSLRIQERASQVSLALLMMLVLVTCINDVSRFWLGK